MAIPIRRAVRIIALGDTMASRLIHGKGADPGKITVIHNWADTAAIVPSDASLAMTAAQVLAALLFLVVHATLDQGRAVLALDRRRTSAVKAWFAGLRVLARRPLAVMGTYLGVTILGLVLAALLAVARINTPPLGVAGFIGALLLTQLAVAVLAWMRCARLFALMEVARGASKV